jgi:hypothetical protein
MGYYMGDFYSGGRARRGDPGFFSFLGKAAKGLVGMIPGVGGALSELIPTGAKAAPKLLTMGGAAAAGAGAIKKIGGAIVKHPGITAAATAAAGAGVGALVAAHVGGSGGRKHKRMNVYNPRALRRALRRAKGFAHMAKQIVRVSAQYKHPKKFRIGHFTRKKKR